MKNILRTTLIFFIIEELLVKVNSLNNVIEYSLIDDYLKANNLKICALLSCNKTQDHSKLIDTFRGKSNLWYSFWDISNEAIEFESLLIRLSHQIGVVIDLSCSEIVEFLRDMSKKIFFHRERYWLMFSPNLNTTINLLETQNINVDAEISIAIPINDTETKLTIYEAYNPSSTRGGKLNITQIGTWNPEDGYNLLQNKTKLENRRDLHGITFKGVVAIPETPNNESFIGHLESVDLPHLNTMSRSNYRLFQMMQQMYNFNIFLQRSHVWGYLQNGRWNGAIGMLNRRESDLSVSGLRWEDKRYGAFEATTNSYAVRVKFIFRHPKLVDAATVFTSPFKNVVWVCILAICIACSYFLSQIFVAENHEKIKTKFADQSINEDSISNSLLLVFGVLLQQGYSIEPVLISSRIVTLTVLVFSVLVFQFYSSFIVGSLLTEPERTIKTTKKLLQSDLELGTDDVPYILSNFEHSRDESTVKIYERIMKTKEESVMKLDKGLNLIKKGGFAFNTDGSRSYLRLKQILNDDEICELEEIIYSREHPSGPGVPNKSPLSEIIKVSIRRMAETGILAYHSKVWLGTKPECPDSIIDFVPVDLTHFSSALILILCGILLSTLILLAEIYMHRYEKCNEKINVKNILKDWFSFMERDEKK